MAPASESLRSHSRSRSPARARPAQLRRQGKIPGVIYGHDRAARGARRSTRSALDKMLAGISAATTIVDVAVDGRAPVKALIREIQRDPLRPAQILHLDFYEIRADEKVTVEVPVHLVGIPDGVRNFGGVLDHSLRELEIEVLPGRHPRAHRARRHRARRSATRCSCATSTFAKAEILNDPDTPVCTVVRAAHRGGARRGRRGGRAPPSRSSSGSRRPRTRTRGRGQAEGSPSRRPEPCAPSWGWATPARSTPRPGTTPGFVWPTIWRPAGGSAPLAPWRPGPRWPRAAGTVTRPPARAQTYMNRSGAALAPLRDLPELRSQPRPADPGGRRRPAAGPVPAARGGLRRRPQRPEERRGRAAAPGLRPAPDRRGPAAPRASRTRDFVLDAVHHVRSATTLRRAARSHGRSRGDAGWTRGSRRR